MQVEESQEAQEVHDAAGQLLAQAMQLHRSGEVARARATYEQALAIAPEHPDVLHLLGMLEGQFGSGERGIELVGRAIERNPLEPMFHNNLGNIHSEMGRLEEAEPCYRRAVELDPERYDARNNLGVLLSRTGRFQAGEEVFKTLLEATPGFTDARENLAYLYLRQGRMHEALTQCAIGLVTAPRHDGLRRLLGYAYVQWDMKDKAIELYRDWLKEEPGHPEAQHYLTALTAEVAPERASDAYVQSVFDGFANSFDAKLAQLEYKAPELIGAEVARQLGLPAKALRIADAGCGTGLCGAHLAPYASKLSGVDLSLGMLHKAVARQLYDELTQAELVDYLQRREAAFDVLVSADTLCYFGALGPFAAAAAASLDPGGLLVFTVEADDDGEGVPDYTLHSHGRYSHRRGYVHDTLLDAGFEAPALSEVILRQEVNRPVRGWLVTARTPKNTTPHA
jgi:predicted TPR repeat methyltransferase